MNIMDIIKWELNVSRTRTSNDIIIKSYNKKVIMNVEQGNNFIREKLKIEKEKG